MTGSQLQGASGRIAATEAAQGHCSFEVRRLASSHREAVTSFALVFGGYGVLFYFPSLGYTACVRGRDRGISIPVGNYTAHGAPADRRSPQHQAIVFPDGLSSHRAGSDKEKADAVAMGGLRRCTKSVEKVYGMAEKGAAVGSALDALLDSDSG